MQTKLIITSFFVFFIFLLSCNQNRQKITEEPVLTIEERLQDRFINRNLASANTILFSGKAVDDKKILLVYTGFDCQSCVDRGFQVLKKLRSENNSHKVFVISTNANIGLDQARNEYYDFVYSDSQELIRMELNFIYTPVILVLDKDNVIIHLNFPKTNSDEREMIKQINNAISK